MATVELKGSENKRHIKTKVFNIRVTYKEGEWHIEITAFGIFNIDFYID